MEFEKLTGKVIVIGIIVIAIFSMMISLQKDNNTSNRISEDPLFNSSLDGLESAIEESNAGAGEKYNVFSSEEPKTSFGSILLFAIVSVTKFFSSAIFLIIKAVIVFPLSIFGIPASIHNSIFTWLIILVIVATWRLVKTA